jgi:hypothetical protein
VLTGVLPSRVVDGSVLTSVAAGGVVLAACTVVDVLAPRVVAAGVVVSSGGLDGGITCVVLLCEVVPAAVLGDGVLSSVVVGTGVLLTCTSVDVLASVLLPTGVVVSGGGKEGVRVSGEVVKEGVLTRAVDDRVLPSVVGVSRPVVASPDVGKELA